MSRSNSLCQNKNTTESVPNFFLLLLIVYAFILQLMFSCVFCSYTQHSTEFTSSVSYSNMHARHVSVVSESEVVSTLWSLNYETFLSQNDIPLVMEAFCWWSRRKNTGTRSNSTHPARSQHTAEATYRTREKRKERKSREERGCVLRDGSSERWGGEWMHVHIKKGDVILYQFFLASS